MSVQVKLMKQMRRKLLYNYIHSSTSWKVSFNTLKRSKHSFKYRPLNRCFPESLVLNRKIAIRLTIGLMLYNVIIKGSKEINPL